MLFKKLHIQVVTTSILFFLLQALLFVWSKDVVLKNMIAFITNPNVDLYDGHNQSFAFDIIGDVQENNTHKIKSLYIFGGSSSRSFFCRDFLECKERDAKLYEELTGLKTTFSMVSSQTMLDVIRVLDNVSVKDSKILVAMYPQKMLTSLNDMSINKNKYISGSSYLYPLKSKKVDKLANELSLSVNQYHYRLFKDINDVIFLLKSMVAVFNDKNNLNINENDYKGKNDRTIFVQWKVDRLVENNKSIFKDTIEYKKRLKRNFMLLSEVDMLARKKGMDLIIFDVPYCDYLDYVFDKEFNDYYMALDSFTKENPHVKHIEFVKDDYNNDKELYSDCIHFLDSGRYYYKDYLIKGVKEIARVSK